jgi:tetratricopeptide (TPR) repeat protein
MRGWISLARGELEESRTFFQACLDAIDENPAEFVPVATSYSSGSLDQIPAQRAAHLLALALLDLGQQDVSAAEKRLDEITRVAPGRGELLRAEILLAKGEAGQAATICEQAHAWRIPYMSDTEGLLLYNLPPLRDVLARALRSQGEVYRAVAEYERLITVDHTTRDRRLVHPTYHARLAELYEEKGWEEKARSEYRRFLAACTDADGGWGDVTEARRRLKALGAGYE